MTHFRLDVTITSITSITSGFWPDVTLDGSLPGGHPSAAAMVRRAATAGQIECMLNRAGWPLAGHRRLAMGGAMAMW
eukprot:COSAG05_NODE_37_length_27688_cov_18.080394_9_plen_77_part_00